MSLTYAIGDIHGRADLLDILLAAIERHRAERPRSIVFLGDYIDRGPDSAGVIARLRALEAAEPETVICLSGNHEDILLRALTDPEAEAEWIIEGGAPATLASYGVDRVTELPANVIEWLRGLRTLYADPLRYFVHAGLRPDRPVEPEDREVRLDIREPFLSGDHDFGRHVVHGHTPLLHGVPEVRAFRTNLDTAVCYGGRLSAGIFTDLQATPTGYLQVAQDGTLLCATALSDLPRIPNV